MPEIDDADGSQPHLKGDKKMPKVPKQKVKEACNICLLYTSDAADE